MGVPIWKKPTADRAVFKKRSRRRESGLDPSLQGALLRRVIPLIRAADTPDDGGEVVPSISGTGGSGVLHRTMSGLFSSRDSAGLWSFRTGAGGDLQRRSSIHGRRDQVRRSLSPRTSTEAQLGNSNWSGWDSSFDLADFFETGDQVLHQQQQQREYGGSSSSSTSSSPSQPASTPAELQRAPSDMQGQAAQQPSSDHSSPFSSYRDIPSSFARGVNHQLTRRNSLRRPQVHFTVPIADSTEPVGFQTASSLLDGHAYESDWWLSPYRRGSSTGPGNNDSSEMRRSASLLEAEERRWASRRLNSTGTMTTSTLTQPDDNCPYIGDHER